MAWLHCLTSAIITKKGRKQVTEVQMWLTLPQQGYAFIVKDACGIMSLEIRSLWKPASKLDNQHKISQFPPKQCSFATPSDKISHIKPLTVRQKTCLDSDVSSCQMLSGVLPKCPLKYPLYLLSFWTVTRINTPYWFFHDLLCSGLLQCIPGRVGSDYFEVSYWIQITLQFF